MNNAAYLSDLGIDLRGRTSGKIKTWCPVCAENKAGAKREKDLSVNIDEGLYQCWSNKCNFKGSCKPKKVYERPDETKIGKLYSRAVQEWFSKRGIKNETLGHFKIWTHGDVIHFNYYRDDTVVNFKKRNMDKTVFGQFPNAEKIVYNIDSLKGKEKAILVEGEIDVLVWHQLGYGEEYGIISLDQGAGVEGSRLDGKLECFQNCAKELDSIKMFYLAGDMDSAGEYTMREVARRLGEYRCKRVRFENKDANDEYLSVDEENAKEYFDTLLEKSKNYPTAGVQVLDDDMMDRMLDEFDNGEKRGTGLGGGHPLDEFYTVMDGEMTGFTGYPGDGKTTFLKNLAVEHAMKNGLVYAVYSPEDADAMYYYKEICKIYMGKNIDRKYHNVAERAEYISAINWVRDKFFYIYPEHTDDGAIELPTNEWINNKIRFLKLQYGVNSYIKDPWNKIHHEMNGMRDDQYLASEIRKEKLFAGGYKACWYVIHPNKPSKTKNGAVLPPDQYDLSQGAMWNNGLDNIICVFRPERGVDARSPRVDILFQKIKKKGVVGQEGKLEVDFIPSRHRYEYTVEDMGDVEGNFEGFYRSENIIAEDIGFEDVPF
jgi:twinkle protein